MEATLNFNIPLSIHELADLIREQLPKQDRDMLAELLLSDGHQDEDEPTQAQLVAEMKQAVKEMNLIKQGKAEGRPVKELLNEL